VSTVRRHSSGVYWAKALDENERAMRLREFFSRDTGTRTARRNLAEMYASATEGMVMTHLGPYGYTYDIDTACFPESDIPIIRNSCHELVDTLTSKIGAIDPPLPEMLTTRGNWAARRQAEDVRDLVRAEYKQRQGIHSTLHQLWVSGVRLSAGCSGAVAVQFFCDEGRVGARLHDTFDMAWTDNKQQQMAITWLPVEDVVEMYPDSEADIRRCAGDAPAEWQPPTRDGYKMDDWVCVYEGYSAATPSRDGIKVVCVNSGPALEVSEWKHQRCPFVWLPCVQHLYGPLGHAFIHHIWEAFRRDNYCQSRVDRGIGKATESVTYHKTGSLVDKAALSQTSDHKVVEISVAGEVPVTVSNPGFSPEHLEVADRHYATAHGVSGMNAQASQGLHQPGVDSAIGQRYLSALINERYADFQSRYIHAVGVESAECILIMLCELFEDDPKLMRLSQNEDSLREVSARLALRGIDDLKYVFQANAVSGQTDGPAARMQSGYELMQLQALSKEKYAGLQGAGMDLPEELEESESTKRWFEKQMQRWQMAKDDEISKPDFYIPPFEHIDPTVALPLLIDGYQEAQTDELEPERLEFYFMAIADLKAIAARNAAAGASAGAPAAPAPMPTQALQVQSAT
jgi:hypothetical protein